MGHPGLAAVNNKGHIGYGKTKMRKCIKRVPCLCVGSLTLLGIQESLFEVQFADPTDQHQEPNQTDLPKTLARAKRKADNFPNDIEPRQKRSRTWIAQENPDLTDPSKLDVNNNQDSECWNIKKNAYNKRIPDSCLGVPKLLKTKKKFSSQDEVADPRAQRQGPKQTHPCKLSARRKRKTTDLLDVNENQHKSTSARSTPKNPKLPAKHAGTAHLKDVYEEGELLGQGGFGCVYAGIRKADGLPVAIKYVSKKEAPEQMEIPGHGYLPTEVALTSMVNLEPFCSNILRILEWYDDQDHYIMILERPEPCEDLEQLCKKHGSCLPESMARKVIFQLMEALKHCKSRGILHRDIKPENILVQTDSLHVKLFDFGCGDVVKDSYNEYAGTFDYAPPEWYKKKQYLADPSTAWSVGLTLYKLLCGSLPFKTRKQLKRGYVHFPKSMSQECSHLIRWCLRVKSENRPSLEQIEHHKWFHLSE